MENLSMILARSQTVNPQYTYIKTIHFNDINFYSKVEEKFLIRKGQTLKTKTYR